MNPLEYQQDKTILLVAELNNMLTKLEHLPLTVEKVDVLRHLNVEIDNLTENLVLFNKNLDTEIETGDNTDISHYLEERKSEFSLFKLFSPFMVFYNEFLASRKVNENYYNSI